MQSRNRILWGYFFIAPQLIGLFIFSLIPLVSAFSLSMMSWDGFGPRIFVGFKNYIKMLNDPDFTISLINTAYYTVLVVPVGIAFAMILAIALNKVRGKEIYRVFYFAPVVTSSVSVGVIWMWVLNGDFGILNNMLALIGITGPKWLSDTKWVMPSIAMMSIWWGVGRNMVIFLAGLQGISRSYYESADIDGASNFQKFWSITLPLLSPTTFFVAIMSIISSFQVFDQAYVMTEGGPAKASYTLVYHIYKQAFIQFNMGDSSASAVVLFIIILFFTMIQFNMSKRWVHYEG